MIKKTVNNIIKAIVSFNLIVLPAFGTTAPDTSQRTLDKIDTFLKSSSPSDVPFIDYIEKFIPDNTQPLKKFDLSNYTNKKIFVGYGVYDSGQNYCKYVEKPGTRDYTTVLNNVNKFNKHSYATSQETMTYDNCYRLANEFGGKPVSITSEGENSFIQSTYYDAIIPKWIGSERTNCTTPYVDVLGDKQVYFNWSSLTEQPCDISKLNVLQTKNGTWTKSDKTSTLAKCIVEIDSEDFRRPIKICAPWWKIEREYAKPEVTTYSNIDIFKINQADIPQNLHLCTKYKDIAVTTALSKPIREVTCTSYYDTQVAPECVTNPKQDICFVDECDGYIKNACRKTDSVAGFKDYTKAENIVSGNNTIMKGKLDIKTNIYECPPSPPSTKACEEEANVVIYPKECTTTGSDCEGRKNCTQNAKTPEEKAKCSTDFKCEKIYGNPDMITSELFDSSGNLTKLKNYCSNGEIIYFDINTQNKTSKKCEEYEYYNLSEQVTQKCVVDRQASDYTVDTSLTAEDIYMNDPLCVRLNNVVAARPPIDVNITYVNNGYSKTVVKKSYLDEVQTNVVNNVGSDALIVNSAMNAADLIASANQSTANKNQSLSTGTSSYTCNSDFDTWTARNDVINQKISYTKTATNGTVTTETRLTDGLYLDSNGLYFPYKDVVSETDCIAIKNKITTASSYSFDGLSNYCKIYTPAMTSDVYSSIKGNGSLTLYTDSTDGSTYYEYPSTTYITKDAITKDSCDRLAFCLNGTYNVDAYNSSGLNQCQITEGEGIEYKQAPVINEVEVSPNPNFDENCKPYSSNGSYRSQFDGTQDIFSIQEVVTGDFGYFSNYNSHPFINNVVKLGKLGSEKEVYPIKKMSMIDDNLIYEGHFTQQSITTKKPNIAAGVIGGSTAGVATYLMLTTGPIGWIVAAVVVIVGVICAMIFGKAQKFNRQFYDWKIYKLVPVERYIKNIYGYDKRIPLLNDDQTTLTVANGKVTLFYAHLYGDTGTLKPGDFKATLQKLLKMKEGIITCLGFDLAQVQAVHSSMEKDIIVGYPKCKKLSFSCNKTNSQNSDIVKDPFVKKMVNNYIGAVNGVSIVVPYLGEYEVKAYDQFDNLLGTITIKEDEFIDMTSNIAKYAQINFGLDMELATGIIEGRNNKACRGDLMVEWGGGVSGIYYENNFTGVNTDCQKSVDAYVKTSSATKLTIRSTTTDRPHVIQLEKPLPFANRVFLVTLGEKEIRKYRCYKDFPDCQNSDFKGVQ